MRLFADGKTEVSPIELVNSRRGPLLSFVRDQVIGRSLRMYGEWAEHELSLIREYIHDGDVILDVGANVGTHTLAFAKWVGRGKVIAIEAQPVVHMMLAINCFNNHLRNVQTVNAVVSNQSGSMSILPEYQACDNVGAMSFHQLELERADESACISQNLPRPHVVPVERLDKLVDGVAVSFVKMDIEDMEFCALQGCTGLLCGCRPVFYFEQRSTAMLKEIAHIFSNHSYNLYWVESQPFNGNNFRQNSENIWWQTEMAILALPSDAPQPSAHVKVTGMEQELPRRLDARLGVSL